MAKARKQSKIRARGNSWQVDFGMVHGHRVQKSFRSRPKAEQWAQAKQVELDNSRIGAFQLSDQHRVDALQAYEELSKHYRIPVHQLPTPALSLAEVTRAYLAQVAPEGGERTVAQVVEEYITAKKRANRRARTISDSRSRMGLFAKTWGETPLNLICTVDLERWLDSQGYKQVTRKNYRTQLVMLFNFGKKRGYTARNPAEGIEAPILDEKIPAIFTVADCEKLMGAAEEHAPEMIPYFAIALFAGLRPSETELLHWSNINFETKTIKVIPATSKKRRQRFVDMSDNLVAWLLPHARRNEQLTYSRKAFERTRKKAKVQWASDILRHSYGSYHLAQHENAAKTSLQMGHRDVDILFNHYRDLVMREDAAKFWAIAPAQESQVLRIPA
jgi:integrase